MLLLNVCLGHVKGGYGTKKRATVTLQTSEEENLMGELSGVYCSFERVISTLFDNLESEAPWEPALDELRAALAASTVSLCVEQKTNYARGAKQLFGKSPDREHFQCLRSGLAYSGAAVRENIGEALVVERSFASDRANDFLSSGDVSHTIEHRFEAAGLFDCVLVALRTAEERHFGPGDRLALRSVAAHFRRALEFRQKLMRSRVISDFKADALEQMGIAGFLVGPDRSMLALNRRAGRFLEQEDGIRVSKGSLHATDSQDDRKLQAEIRGILADESLTGTQRALSLKRPSGRRDLGVLITTQNSPSLVSNRMEKVALIYVRDAAMSVNLYTELMQQLFSFTRAEANLAAGLAGGLRLGDVESLLNIRHNTARAHLRSIFAKADVSCQSGLVHLLANSVPPVGSAIHA